MPATATVKVKPGTNKSRLLAILADGEYHSNQELVERVSWRFGATIHALKKEGFGFDKMKPENGPKWREDWRLIDTPEVEVIYPDQTIKMEFSLGAS